MNCTSAGERGGSVALVDGGNVLVGWPGAPGCTTTGVPGPTCCAQTGSENKTRKVQPAINPLRHAETFITELSLRLPVEGKVLIDVEWSDIEVAHFNTKRHQDHWGSRTVILSSFNGCGHPDRSAIRALWGTLLTRKTQPKPLTVASGGARSSECSRNDFIKRMERNDLRLRSGQSRNQTMSWLPCLTVGLLPRRGFELRSSRLPFAAQEVGSSEFKL